MYSTEESLEIFIKKVIYLQKNKYYIVFLLSFQRNVNTD